jgi:N-acetylmuramoyl-L-alanine amidase
MTTLKIRSGMAISTAFQALQQSVREKSEQTAEQDAFLKMSPMELARLYSENTGNKFIHAGAEIEIDSHGAMIYRWAGKNQQIIGAQVNRDIASAETAAAPTPKYCKTARQDVPQRSPEKQITVLIDPGHGGRESGASGADLKEELVNFQIASEVASILKANGIEPILTRSVNETLPKAARIARVREISEDKKPEMLVSIHADAEHPREARRSAPSLNHLTVIYPRISKTDGWNPQEASEGAQIVAKAMRKNIGPREIRVVEDFTPKINNNDGLFILEENPIPRTLLVEAGFISSPTGRKQLSDPQYIKKIAAGIAEGILNTLGRGEV